jgi:uncharacterized protein (TIGR02996 family)
MSTETALLRAIRDMPDEDTPRLVYADYLEEEGNAARAEFIRVQCALARLPEGDPQRHPLEDRQHELLAEHECEWLGVAHDAMDELEEWTFERGFVHEVAASPYFMRGPGSDLCTANLVRRWRVTSGQDNFPEDLKEAGQRGWFARLDAVDLSGWYTALGELSGFLSRSNFGKLRELDLTGRDGLDALPELLAFAPFRDRLKVLRCGGGTYGTGGRLDAAELIRALGPDCRLEELAAPNTLLTAADLGDLLAARMCSQLTSLDVGRNGIEAGGWTAFRSAPCRLRELDLSHLIAFPLDRLFQCPSLRDLRILRISSFGQSAENVRALAESPFWAQAEELRAPHEPVPVPDYDEFGEDGEPVAPEEPAEEFSLDPLFASAGSKQLRVLDVAGCAVRDAGVAKLCGAAWAESLTYLDLSQNYLSDEALRTIAKSGRFKRLHTLHLNFNSPYHQQDAAATDAITDTGLRVLADCPDLTNLRVLSLSGIRLTATSLDAVLNSPHWKLSGLRLSQCQLRPNVVEILASSPRLSRLEVLDLSGNDEIDTDDLEPLTESEYLSPQTELDIRGLDAGDAAIRTALRERLGRRLSE